MNKVIRNNKINLQEVNGMALDMNTIMSGGLFVVLIIIGIIGFKELGKKNENKDESKKK